MIALIKGKVRLKTEHFLIIENQGLGYKVFVPASLLLEVKEAQEVELFTYQHVREDALQLFGFKSQAELNLFELLLSVSGIGPKTALGVFSVAGPEDISSAIVNEDSSILKQVSGIGAKTADRIVLELKNKVNKIVSGQGKGKKLMAEETDVVSALVALGYSSSQAREALKQSDKTISDISDKVKACLKILNNYGN